MKAWAKNFLGSHKGFTIVELLIVLVVIGLLAAIIFVSYGAVQNAAHDTTIKDDLKKFTDIVNLQVIDTEIVPEGGATSSLTGDSTILPGVVVVPQLDSYDASVANLYYCAGTLNGTSAFAFVARSLSGKVFKYASEGGLSEITTPMTWTATNDGVGVCTAAGFTAPYTWSYGYNPDTQYLWFDWAGGH